MNDFFIQLPEIPEPQKAARKPEEIRQDIKTQRIRLQRAARCCNGVGMQKALKRIEELENELKEQRD